MNINERKTMNNLKKVGLSALAGSLVAFSASASEVTITGGTQLAYSSAEGNQADKGGSNGKGIGTQTDLSVNAGGELDNGFTVNFFMAINTDTTLSNSSSQTTIGMGDMGTIVVTANNGGPANAIDDVLPFAYEEAWDGTTHSANNHVFGSATQDGSVSYITPAFDVAGASISASATYDSAANVERATASSVVSGASGTAYTVKVAHESGLTLGAGAEEVNNSGQGTTKVTGAKVATGYAKYVAGPLSVGYQESYNNPSHSSSAVGQDIESTGYGIAYTAGDMSFSYSEITDSQQDIGSDTTHYDAEMSAIQATYTMGAMTAGISFYETTNAGYASAKEYEETEISLSFAF